MAQRSKFLESLKKNIITQKEVNVGRAIADAEAESMNTLHESNSQNLGTCCIITKY